MRKPVFGFFREKRDIEEFKFKADHYKQAYHELFSEIDLRGVEPVFLMGNGTYLGGGVFSKHWVQVEKNGEFTFEKRGKIKVDVLWVKDCFEGEDIEQINSLEFRKVCSDKNLTYNLLEEFQPKSFLTQNEAEIAAAFEKIPTSKVAVKTLVGNSGTGVFVGEKSDFNLAEFGKDFPLQVQEFIETDCGVPNIVEGRHDFRVIIINGEAILATLRTPPEGGLKSNIGYGGTTFLLEKEKIPQDLLEICARIDAKLATVGADRFYSADFGLTKNGWRLFEVNSMPGTINRGRGEFAIEYQRQLANFFAAAAIKNSVSKIGRAERVNLPNFEISDIPAKIDSGAWSSSIDCERAEIFEENGVQKLRFVLFSKGRAEYTGREIVTENFETTEVKNSNGVETRFVIFEKIELGGQIFESRFTLARRAHLRYPILIGRRLLRETGFLIDVSGGQGLPDDEEERDL